MDVRDYVQSHAREFIDDLKQWLAIPPLHAMAGAEASAYLWEELAATGADLW